MKQLIKWGLAMIALTAISFSQLNAQTTHTLTPTDDVWYKDNFSGGVTFNTNELKVRGADEEYAYLKFDLSSLSGDVTAASLELTLTSSTGGGIIDIFKSSDVSWTEAAGFNTATRPMYNASTDQVNTNAPSSYGSTNTLYTWTLDPTSLSTGTQLTLVVSKASARNIFGSSESASPPQLTITVSDSGGGATCDDGIQNGDETGVDCGGSNCPVCPTCSDGIQNGNETGIDCGGDCSACAGCDDGIQNGDETGVDCGGSNCPACPTCDDGIQNGDETGEDCGGSCDACPDTGSGESVWTQDGNVIHYTTGNVGIGTSTPDALLTVAGEVHARKVKIMVDAGADFVFQNGYEPPSLEEINAFVKANEHLPGIASEQEMLEEGVDVGKFNIQLLQKIEEMTLYMIDFQEQIKELKEENEQLKKRVEELEEQ